MTEENKKTIWAKLAAVLGIELSEAAAPVEEVAPEAEPEVNLEVVNADLLAKVAELEAKLAEAEELKSKLSDTETKLSEVKAELARVEAQPVDKKVTLSATPAELTPAEMWIERIQKGF